MSKSTSNGTEYADRVHECLRSVPIYKNGAFSCSSLDEDDDDDDDEDIKRILAEHGQLEPENCETAEFSSVYKATVETVMLSSPEEGATEDPGSRAVFHDEYADWDEALGDVAAAFPALGVGRDVVMAAAKYRTPALYGDVTATEADPRAETTARELRRCLERALCGRDVEAFAVAQPHCAAIKNLDFGKPISMSRKSACQYRNKVEHWMNKYVVGSEDRY